MKGRQVVVLGMIIACVAVTAACEDSGGGPALGDQAAWDSKAEGGPTGDLTVHQDLPEALGEKIAPADSKEAEAALDALNSAFDQPCESNADCPTGVCVYTRHGKRCTVPCIEDCPEGWLCKQLPGGVDTQYACVPAHITTCRPCTDGEDCQEFGFQPEGLCHLVAPEAGSFCITPCSAEVSCPSGFVCAELPGEPVGAPTYCQPEGGECPCDEVAVQQGLSTPCELGSVSGKCLGERRCTAEGLTACDAPLPTPEQCDGKDNDCDGMTDEGNPDGGGECTLADKKGLCAVGALTCDGGEMVCEPSYVALDEACDGQDNDCDGESDEKGASGCTLYYLDKDGDGYGVESATLCLCEPSGYYTAVEASDCDDTVATAHPGAGEDCDGVDNDCDGLVDVLDPNILVPPCELQEGVCAGSKKPASMCNAMEWDVCSAAEYLAQDPAYQEGFELDCDGVDNDCDGLVDEDFAIFPETCNDVDDNCDGVVDEGLKSDYFIDLDGDLYGDEKSKVTACFPPPGTIATGLDCDDSDPTIHPGSDEVCDAKDNDCNGVADQFEVECSLGCEPGPMPCKAGQWGSCLAAEPLSCIDWETCKWTLLCAMQCPQEPAESCNGLDDNCNGEIDEGVESIFYLDVDGDGWGVEGATTKACFVPPGYSTKAGDCDDNVAEAHPEGTEVCDNLDNDCDGAADEGLGTATCGLGPCKHTVNDCVNGIPNPCDPFEGALPEVCDGIDNDCDGPHDEDLGTTTCGQGLCDHTVVNCLNGKPQACNPLEGQGPEVCDGFDNDCDGLIDQIFSCTPGQQEGAVCGQCGKQTRVCSNTCTWGAFGPCQGEGTCQAGQQQSQPCGLCGTQYRNCNNQCQWDPWGTCLNEGVCAPGEQGSQSCGYCGMQYHSCNAQCQWNPWGACQNPGTCAPGQQQSQSCGPCGLQYRNCNWMCEWDAWGNCQSQGVCQPGQQQSQSCGNCGTQYRSCNGSCYWDSWGWCQNQGSCTPGQVDTESQACGCGTQTRTRTCDWGCNWGAWSAWSTCQGGGTCTPGKTETQSQACGMCGTQTRSHTCDGNCNWGGWSAWGSCNGQGVCTPNQTTGSGCDGCSQKTCQGNCQWGSCALKPGSQCEWKNGTNWKCCGYNKWKFCLGPSYGCIWSDQCVTCSGCGCY
jgi:hypothetical protein